MTIIIIAYIITTTIYVYYTWSKNTKAIDNRLEELTDNVKDLDNCLDKKGEIGEDDVKDIITDSIYDLENDSKNNEDAIEEIKENVSTHDIELDRINDYIWDGKNDLESRILETEDVLLHLMRVMNLLPEVKEVKPSIFPIVINSKKDITESLLDSLIDARNLSDYNDHIAGPIQTKSPAKKAPAKKVSK